MTTADLQSLYREQVLKHSREPCHFRRIDNADREAAGNNPLCGDSLRVYISMNDQCIKDIAFEGSGCAISIASASMMTQLLDGSAQVDALETIHSVCAMLEASNDGGENTAHEDTPLAALGAVRQYPTRVKCATLAWHAARSALCAEQQTVSTE